MVLRPMSLTWATTRIASKTIGMSPESIAQASVAGTVTVKILNQQKQRPPGLYERFLSNRLVPPLVQLLPREPAYSSGSCQFRG